VAAAPSKYKISLPDTVYVGCSYNLLDYYSCTPEAIPELIFGSAKLSSKRAEIIENELGVFLLPLEKGSFTLTIKSYNGKNSYKTVKAVEPDASLFAPEIVSSVRRDAQLADYSGLWKINCVSSMGVSFPPEMAALGSASLRVDAAEAGLWLMRTMITGNCRVENGELLLSAEEDTLVFRLHENGMLSMVLNEAATLWFAR